MGATSFEKQMANREVCDMIFVDYKTKKPFLPVDYANTSSVELTGENVYAYGGKGHPKKVTFSGDRGGTMTIETQIQTPKLWELMSGGTSSTTTSYIKKVETKVGASNKITLDETKTIDAGSVCVYKADDAALKTELKSTVSGKDITLTESLEENTEVIVFYGITRDEKFQVATDILATNANGELVGILDLISKMIIPSDTEPESQPNGGFWLKTSTIGEENIVG